MAIWRNPDLEAVFGGSLDVNGIREASITRLVHEATRESDLLDFKSSLWLATRGVRLAWTEEQEFAKDVAAFANHRGGLLLVGVDESGGTATGVNRISAAVVGTRRLSGRPRAATVADLAAVDTQQRRLAVTYQALAVLFQWFGLAEPRQLRPDGTIVPTQFQGSKVPDVIRWAGRFGVNAER